MTITLRPDQEKLIAEAIQTGAYAGIEDVIDCALQNLWSEEEFLIAHKDEISAKIDSGLDDFEKGNYFTAEESREDMAKRKAEWLRNRRPE